jgi:hypothetical protein
MQYLKISTIIALITLYTLLLITFKLAKLAILIGIVT